ncbi:Acyl-homoserine lactone (AHL) acylase PvdQ [Micromonospora viridifaciens]|uniref:Acyl-homoserine lactone (AHL) acylase PvdQ n=1 Tax=Micromonospora viridifaciens TaxID=1881 RepID=A0A1C4VJG9_MICVI|nr:penicillin acylase family protein [Micromonospora viridifaciens]SCE83951.1 Acyl-homoserine lactone (AHL) acylase PvdQ [Micromonospora viridifaciens]
MNHAQNNGLSRRRILGGAAGLAAGAVAAAGLPSDGALAAPPQTPPDHARWNQQAAHVTITRDDWGIAHVVGKTDAHAVFGMIYAQAEDDFNRVERNYLVSLGRLAEAEGESAIWQDLRQRLFIDPEVLKGLYANSPAWLRKLMDAWADGLNYFLATHPEVRPRVITRFEPWMALSFSEGSIGGDIERVSLTQLRAFYDTSALAMTETEPEAPYRSPSASNGIAIAPSHTQNGKALLLINPHTSFYFRSELHMTSDEGLNAYGAATWGQFFIYQGFNDNVGWMHTSAAVDNVDEFSETIVTGADGSLSYRYGSELRPVTTKTITLSYRTADGGQAQRSFITYATHHGPIVRQASGKWIAFALMNKPVEALQQSFLRTKARDYADYLEVAKLKANSSNNTLFADSKGNIAFLLPQFMPIRDNRFNYTQPVDGSDPATDWQGLHSLESMPQAVNPQNGWAFNTNNWPWTAAGADSPNAADFPRYFNTGSENERARHVIQQMTGRNDFTPQALRDVAFDSYLGAFADLIPQLLAAWDKLPAGDPQKVRLSGPIGLLRGWNYRWSADSTATSLAIFWAAGSRSTDAQRLASLDAAVDRLTNDFGSWQVPWGEINRFQRNSGAITQTFDDAKPSIPVPFTSGTWGSLATYPGARQSGTKRFYATSGNTFVAVVEFGPRLRAWAVREGGNSGNPDSPHFTDQAERYASGNLRSVYFYPEDLKGHVERRYKPGK